MDIRKQLDQLSSLIKSDEFMFFMNADVFVLDEDENEISHSMTERNLHSTAEDILQELIGQTFSSEIDDEEGNTRIVKIKITSVSENR